MTKEELAKELHGNEYGEELDAFLEAQAVQAGLVVVFGYSDDLTEFRGAVHDETGCSAILLTKDGIFNQDECDSECKYFRAAREAIAKSGNKIKARYDSEGWTYETTIPHATFDIMEDGRRYCRGIVFSLADTAAAPVPQPNAA
jgi:hypothetical protein